MLQNTDTARDSRLEPSQVPADAPDYGLTVMVTVAAAEEVDASRALNVNESVPVKFAAGV